MTPMVYPNHSKGCYREASAGIRSHLDLVAKTVSMEKLLGCVCASTTAVSPGRKDENRSYTVSEPSQIFKT